MSKGQPIGVLGMFSEKKLSPADFEILGLFCEQVSNELASFFRAAEFLSIKWVFLLSYILKSIYPE